MTPTGPPPRFVEWRMSDGYVVRGRVWPADGPTVIYLHGIQSHGGWFEWSGGLLASLGCNVIMPDRRGSGLNREARGDAQDNLRWVLDVEEIIADCKRRGLSRELRLVGVSWGGKLAVKLADRMPRDIASVLLITPGVFPAVDVSSFEKLRIAAALLSKPDMYAAIPLSDAALFTDNPAGRKFIDEDELTLHQVTARFFWHSRRLDREIQRWPAGRVKTPLTIVLCGRDRIIRNAETREWARRVSDGRAKIVEFPEDVHTLEFNTDRSGFEAVLRDWTHAIPYPAAT
jgi:acylglycerol lipase